MSQGGSVAPPSERSFGLLFAAVAAAAMLWCAWRGFICLAVLFAAASLALAAAAVRVPSLLAVPNRLWFRLGMLLNKVVSPVVLGAMFFLVVTPVGLIRRMMGGDALRLKLRTPEATYWVERDVKELDPSSFQKQF